MYNIHDEKSFEQLRVIVDNLVEGFVKKLNESWTPESTKMAYDVKIEGLDQSGACALALRRAEVYHYLSINAIVRPCLLINRSMMVASGSFEAVMDKLKSEEGKEVIVQDLRKLLLKASEEDDD